MNHATALKRTEEGNNIERASEFRTNAWRSFDAFLQREGLTRPQWEQRQQQQQLARDADPMAAVELQRRKNQLTYSRGNAQ